MSRWIAFNCVGALGVLVQLGALWLLTAALGWNYLPATLAAVELAVLHNFVWHAHWTWADRAQAARNTGSRRLLRFHLTNGLMSLAGNAVLMHFFVTTCHQSYLAANLLSIGGCSLLTFFAGDRFVFRQERI